MSGFVHPVGTGQSGDGFGVGDVTIRFDPRKMADLMRGPDGPVSKFIVKVTHDATQRAKSIAPVSEPDVFGRNNPGNLRDHHVARFDTQHDGVHGFIVVDVPYASWAHEGAEPHVMPRMDHPYVFEAGGTVVATLGPINHPGNLPNRWLVRAIHDELVSELGATNVHGDSGN